MIDGSCLVNPGINKAIAVSAMPPSSLALFTAVVFTPQCTIWVNRLDGKEGSCG